MTLPIRTGSPRSGRWPSATSAEPGYEDEHGASIVDPDGHGPAIGFLQVPEPKTSKNRMHIDIRPAGEPPWDLAERERLIRAKACRARRRRSDAGARGDVRRRLRPRRDARPRGQRVLRRVSSQAAGALRPPEVVHRAVAVVERDQHAEQEDEEDRARDVDRVVLDGPRPHQLDEADETEVDDEPDDEGQQHRVDAAAATGAPEPERGVDDHEDRDPDEHLQRAGRHAGQHLAEDDAEQADEEGLLERRPRRRPCRARPPRRRAPRRCPCASGSGGALNSQPWSTGSSRGRTTNQKMARSTSRPTTISGPNHE